MSRPTLRLYDGYDHTSPHLKQDVKDLQLLLKGLGFRINADGEYGNHSEQVVKMFQKSKNMKVDGIFGPLCWSVLLNKSISSDHDFLFHTSFEKWNKQLIKQLEESKKYELIIRKVAAQYQIPPALIAGIGSRESHWGLALNPVGPTGTGDNGHGRGLMQIDDRWHHDFIESEKWSDANENIIYGAAVLKNCIEIFRKKTEVKSLSFLFRAGTSGYNCGPSRAIDAFNFGYDIDYFTTGRDYSKDVFNRAGWFQLHGW